MQCRILTRILVFQQNANRKRVFFQSTEPGGFVLSNPTAKLIHAYFPGAMLMRFSSPHVIQNWKIDSLYFLPEVLLCSEARAFWPPAFGFTVCS